MIYYPIQTLVEAGIDEILVVTGGEHAGDFLKLLGNEASGGQQLEYTYQEGKAVLPMPSVLQKTSAMANLYASCWAIIFWKDQSPSCGSGTSWAKVFQRGDRSRKIWGRPLSKQQSKRIDW